MAIYNLPRLFITCQSCAVASAVSDNNLLFKNVVFKLLQSVPLRHQQHSPNNPHYPLLYPRPPIPRLCLLHLQIQILRMYSPAHLEIIALQPEINAGVE